MSDVSPILALPYLLPSQAQKHVIHNEALRQLDVLAQLSVEEFDATTPPAAPVEGAVYALGAAPLGAWAGHPFALAAFTEGAWLFVAPQTGWRAAGRADLSLRLWTGSAWQLVRGETQNLDMLGVNGSADTTNRLSVRADATLLSHDGAGHQLKINKNAAGDTASLLYQSGWSGRAEMGTTGSDDFALKVSANGSAWLTALQVAAATGVVQMPQGATVSGTISGTAVQQSASDVTAGRLARADYTYGRGNLLGAVAQSGGVPTGAVIERGSNSNGEYVRFADGTQMCWHRLTGVAITEAIGSLYRSAALSWTFPAAFVLGNVSGAQISGRISSVNGLSFNAPYGARTTAIADARAYAVASTATTEVHLSATGRWF